MTPAATLCCALSRWTSEQSRCVGVGRFRQLLYRAGVRGQLSWANLLLPLPAGLPVQALIGIVRVVVLLGLGLLVAAVVLKAREPGTYFLRSNTISIVNFSVGAACLLALLSTWAAFVRRLVRCEAQQGLAGWHAGWKQARMLVRRSAPLHYLSRVVARALRLTLLLLIVCESELIERPCGLGWLLQVPQERQALDPAPPAPGAPGAV